MTVKTSIIKDVINILCLIHNQNNIKSIVPHHYQEKQFSFRLIDIEFRLLNIVEEIIHFLEWDKMEQMKEIFKYLINKILNQANEGVIQLKEDEYSYHLTLYRCFGLIMNSFCFNYAFSKNCTLIEAIQYFKTTFFESQDQIELLVDMLLKDYFKLFGFIAGVKNNFFNYYDRLGACPHAYFLLKESHLLDFTLLKYLLIMSDKKIDILSFYKLSNIENVYSSFEKGFILKKAFEDDEAKKEKENSSNNNTENNNNEPIIIDPQLFALLRDSNQRRLNPALINHFLIQRTQNRNSKEEKIHDEFNCILQWRLLLDILICFMKNDSCLYWNLMRFYTQALSSETKRDLFNVVKNNKYAMEDLRNILKEKILHEIIAKGNLVDLKTISSNISEYLQVLFEENNEFTKILDELTNHKMDGETKMLYLKDSYLKNFDLNYYFSFKDKSAAQRYILDFKKDIIKPYNYYYYNPSKLTFEFFEKVYEKILLNKNNLELMLKIVKKLLSDEKVTPVSEVKSVRNSLLPIFLNYLSMLGVINSKLFIKFKLENKDLINKICQVLDNSVKNNKNNDILEKDLEENVKQIINQLNRYEIINESINGDLSKLNEYDYNTEILEKLRKKAEENKNNIKLIPVEESIDNEKKKSIKNLKDKYKKKLKNKDNLS